MAAAGPRADATEPSVRHVFLDFGGTLVTPYVDMSAIFGGVARELGVEVPMPEFLRANEEIWWRLWPRATEYLGQLPSFADTVHELALRRIGFEGPVDRFVLGIRKAATSPKWHPPFPEAESVLEALTERGFTPHLISNSVDYLPELLDNLGWSHHFATVTFAQEVGANKPDPRIFRRALERSGASPSDSVHVGDSWKDDVQGALGVGMRPVWLNRRGAGEGAGKGVWALRDLSGLLEAPFLSSTVK